MEAEQKSLVGKKIGRYELRQVIGEGGMATVFRAYDLRLERDVALKLFRHEAFSPAVARRMLKRFDREAKSLARLSHPNIVEVLDYGSFEDSLFLVMKYFSGGTLKEKAENRLTYPQAAHLLAPVARALDYAHREGIIHRDVKPANILLTKDGDPMLSDFGIAKILDDNNSVSLTATNVGVGTPEYMAPEQWVNKVTPRSDIYALGIIFYELVTGAKPYAADTPAGVAIKQATEPIPDPRRFILELPDQVVAIILKALARRPEDRFENMAEFAIALEKLAMEDAGSTETAGEESAEGARATQTRAQNGPAKPDPLITISQSKIFQRKSTGWMGWMILNVVLSLVLGILVAAAAITHVQGVVTGPVQFYLPPLPANQAGGIPNLLNELLDPLSTAASSFSKPAITPPAPTPRLLLIPSPTSQKYATSTATTLLHGITPIATRSSP